MADTYRIGSIFGIDIELHWTFVGLMLITLLVSLWYGDLLLFILIALLFACVLVHELSHCMVSLRNNIKVRKIILLPLGGVSVIDVLGIDPKVEFNISIAGPLMSLLLGALFGFLAIFSPPGPITEVLQFLFEINILLGIFNLLPAFPTDGGRVFRSYLERKYDQYTATIMTIRASNAVMGLFIIGTLIYVLLITAPFFYKEFVLLWNIMIVFFLYSGAQSEKQIMEIRKESEGLRLSDVASKRFVMVKPEDGVQQLYETVKRTKEHLLITRIGGGYAYVNLLRREKLNPSTRAMDIATQIPRVKLSANLVDVLEAMEANESSVAAVVSGSKLVGIITSSHLQAFISLHLLRARKEK